MGVHIIEEENIADFFEIIEELDIGIEKAGRIGIALGKLLYNEIDAKVVRNDGETRNG